MASGHSNVNENLEYARNVQFEEVTRLFTENCNLRICFRQRPPLAEGAGGWF